MRRPPPPPDKLARDRQGRPLVPALWLGPESGPHAATSVHYACPWCGGESVIEVQAWVIRSEWAVVSGRDAGGEVFVRDEHRVLEWGALAPCLHCGLEFALRIRGRLFAPWTLGTGPVKPMGAEWQEEPPEGREGEP